MKYFLITLRDICNKNLIGEKVLIVPTYSIGRQIVQALTKEGYSCLNLKTETLHGIAEKICRPYFYKQGLSLIQPAMANYLMLQTLKKLSGSLKYFNKIKVTPGFSKVILNSISDLKMAGLSIHDMNQSAFTTIHKGLDIKTIASEYQNILCENNYVDNADLYQIALENHSFSTNGELYILPSNLRLQWVEKQFLEKLVGCNAEIADLTPVQGLIRPRGCLKPSRLMEINTDVFSDQGRRRWLHDIDNVSPPFQDGTVEMFQAYGESNEIREIFRRIKNRQLPLEQVAIFYTAREPYTQFVYNFSQSRSLPVTFGDGIDIINTRPGRLFFGLLDWIGSNYDVSKIHSLITSGDFLLCEENAPSTFTVARILRSSTIGWGRDRYTYCLDRQISDCEVKLNDGNHERKHERLNDLLSNLKWVKIFINSIFERLPIPDSMGEVSYSSFVKGLASLVSDYARTACEADGEAKNAIIEQLNIIVEDASEIVPVEEAVNLASAMVEGIRVDRSVPQPGHLHVCHYQKALWVNRPYNFIVGLDANRFPGQTREDAILLDTERQQLSNSLFLKREQPRDNTYEMAQLLASLSGNITISYSAFDTLENREIFPSSLLLQVYRLQTGDRTKDYSQLMKSFTDKKAFIPFTEGDILDEAEWWLNRALMNIGIREPLQTVVSCYENIRRGLVALENRLAHSFTAFDGKIQVNSDLIDPRRNHELVMSCSQLEKLAACPFGYLLKYILRVEPPNDIVYDPGIWLDPAIRGALLHGIFEKFYKELNNRSETPNLVVHEDFLYEIADELVAEQKFELPPPSEVVYEHERREVLESCRIFLASEEEQVQGVTPSFFELPFGLTGESNEDLGEIGPVPIELPGGEKFYLRGKIDRVDRLDEDSFITLDYKTGGTYAYSEQKYFKGGRQLQHTLYAIALEKVLTEKKMTSNPRVIESGYIFPTLKGEGSRIMRRQDKRKELYDLLGHLMDILASGAFNMTDDDGDCRFCDYSEICQRQVVEESLKELLEGLIESDLESFRRLRNYD